MTSLAFLAIAAMAPPPQVAPEVLSTPAAVVATRVRGVLSAHDSESAWKDLAGSIPSLALAGGADLESTFAAARLAQDMSSAPLPVAPVAAPPSGTYGWPMGLARTLWWCALTMVLSALALATRGSLPRLARSRGPRPDERCGTARALASEGLPIHEIARRTGLAREAVSVLVGAQGR